MAIVFGFDDDDLEPIDWLERIDSVDEASWLPNGLSFAVVFLDLALFDPVDPGEAINAIIEGCSSLRLEQWGYLAPDDDGTAWAIAKFERDLRASPILHHRYAHSTLVAAVVSAPLTGDAVRQRFADHLATVDVIGCRDSAEVAGVLRWYELS